jgi:hypothetical protein
VEFGSIRSGHSCASGATDCNAFLPSAEGDYNESLSNDFAVDVLAEHVCFVLQVCSWLVHPAGPFLFKCDVGDPDPSQREKKKKQIGVNRSREASDVAANNNRRGGGGGKARNIRARERNLSIIISRNQNSNVYEARNGNFVVTVGMRVTRASTHCAACPASACVSQAQQCRGTRLCA